MRSNVRKMWTALLAVLFAAAVGFGLWFAFAPAARPANVHAAEEPSVIIKVVEQQPELKSYEDPSGDLISARNPIIEGTVTLPDETVADLTEYSRDAEFRIYTQETGGEPIGHFRPLDSDTGTTFTRYLQVGIKITGYTDLIYSNRVPLTITKPNSVSLSVSFNGGSGFDAGTSLGDVNTTTGNTLAEDRLVVSVVYDNNFSTARELSFSDKQEYGSYWVTYPNDKDQFEYSKDEQTLKIHYREGGQPYSAEVTIYVDEAFITAPTPEDSSVELVYNGKSQGYSFLFYDDNTMQATPSGGAGAHEEDKYTVSVADAGDYSIKFSAKSGYRFQTLSSSIPANDIEKVGDKIIGVTYHFTIKKATIGSVAIDSNASFKTSYTYDDDTITPPADTAITMTPETTFTLPEGVEALTAEWAGAELIYTYTGINGTAYGPSSKLPENAGEYSWTVKISGMKNFNDFTGSGANGGAGSFVIEKKTLSVPALTSAELAYTGEAQSATSTYEEDLMSFDGDLDTESRIDVGTYHATFTLKDADNYKWADGAAVSGNKGEIATVTWHIVQAENKATVSLDDWTYGTTANSPSLTADFGAGTVKYTYSGTTNAGDSDSGDTAPTQAGSYTVTATIAETTNYKGATATDTFEVLRAPIGLPSFTTSTFSYNGQNQTPEFSAAVSGFTHDLAAKKDANTYTVAATLDGNHQWNTANASGLYVYNYELKWTISPAEIGVEGTLSIKGWMYGEEANKPGGVELNDETSALLGTATATFKYEYKLSSEGSAYTTTAPADAGDYTVRLTISVNNNFTPYSTTDNFTIAKKTVNVNWSETPLTYDGTVQTPTAGTNDFVNGDDVSLTVAGGQTDAGTSYTATASLAGTDAKNYVLAESTKSTTFTIAKKSIGIDWGKTEFTYNGEEQAPTATPTGVVVGDDLTLIVTVDGEHENAGDYTAEASLSGTDAGNYQLPDEYTTQFTIHKATVSVGEYISEPEGYEGTNPNDRQIVYSGVLETSQLIIKKSDDLFTVGDRKNAEGQVSVAVTVGQYSVTLTLTKADNYKWSGGSDDEIKGAEIVVKYWITQSQFAITVSLDKTTWTYGEAAGNPSISGNTSNGAESFQYYASEADAEKGENVLSRMPTDAGTYWVVGVVSATDDYAQSVSEPVEFTIEKVVIGIEWGDAEFTYNGGEQAPTATATGAVKGESLSLTLEGKATAAGDYKATVTGITIGGKAAENYALPSTGLTKDFKILQRKVNVELKSYTVIYKGAAFSGSFTTEGKKHNNQTLFTVAEGYALCGSDTLEGTFTYPENAINAGSYAWGEIEWSNTNYSVNVTNRTEKVFTIAPAEITVTINSQSFVYGQFKQTDEQLQSLYTVNGLVSGSDSVTVTLSYSQDETTVTSPKNFGDYTVSATISGNPNYVLAEDDVTEGTLTITKKTLTIKGPTSTIEYGEAAPKWDVAKDVAYDELGFAEDKELLDKLITLGTGYEAGDGVNPAVNPYDITVTVDTGDILNNYDYKIENGTLTVTPRDITVTITNVTTTYGTMGELKVDVTRSDNKDPIYSGDLVGSVTELTDPARYANVFKLVLKNEKDEVVEHTAKLDNGTYFIVLDESSKNSNYDITVTEGTYTVGRYGLSINLSQNLHAGETSPVYDGLAWTYSAKANYTVAGQSGEIDFTDQIVYYERTLSSFAETETQLDGAPVDAGFYWAVLPATAASDNFEPTSQVSTDFTIAQREVDVEWLVNGNKATTFRLGYNGDTGYSITAQYQGWKNGSESATATPLTVTKPDDFRNVGDYTFKAAFATDAEKGNYKFGDKDDEDSVTQTFSIAQAPITVAIKPQTSIYGEDIVSLEVPADMADENSLYTIEGEIFDNADTIFTLSTKATNTSDAQSYQITGKASGLLNSGNYKVTFVSKTDSGRNYGTYTITPRPVKIVLNDSFQSIYGTDISAVDNHEKLVSLSGLSFTGGDGTTGSPFLEKDSDAKEAAGSAMRFAFAGSGTYGAQSAANTTWTVTARLSDQASDDLKNYTFVPGDTCTMTVIPRPITVTLPELGNTSYTYGTGALQNAFPTFKASEALSNDWAGYGEPIVFNDNAAGGVYTLVVKNADDDEITLSASTPVGTYTLDGKKGGDSNYSVTFTTEQTFKVTAAQFKVNAQDPVSVSVGYTGENYYFRSDAEAENPADTYLFNYGLNVTTADFVLSEKDIAFTWGFKVGGNSLTCLTDAGKYTVSYTVTAENFKTVTGSFEVEIKQAKNSWTAGMTTTDGGAYVQASWTYGNPEKYSSLNWTDTFTGYTPSTQFVAAFGEVKIEYYKTRTEAEGGYEYSDKIDAQDAFFGFETAAGTYYVKVFVEATDNFTGLTAHGTIEVGKRALDIDWAANNITVDGETHGGTNTTIGFVNTLMTVDTESLPQGLTIEGDPNENGFTGEITVKVEAEGTTQFYLYFELKDLDNYCWEESATVSGDKGERIQINFTTNALQNNVTFKFKWQDDDPSQNTGISISFGTELYYKFATSSGDTIGDAHLLIFADSTLADETQNYYISFARTTQEDEGPKNDIYSISSLEGADAGYYWLRVQVYPTSDSSYGYGIGYLKICVTKLEITQDVIDGIDFGLSEDELHFTYDGRPHQPSTEGVPSYLHVKFSGSATNVCDGKVTVTATFTIADDNYKFADGVSPTREITVVIDPAEIGHIVWSDREYTYNGTDQTGDVYAYFVDVFGVEHRLRVTADGGFKTVTADGTTFEALLELYEAQEDFCIQNYKFAEGLAELTHVYKMAKATVEIGIGDAEAVYTGEPIEIDQTQYALRTAISLSDPEILAFLNQIHLIAVDDDGNPAVNVGSYKIILEKEEWAYTNIEIVFNDSYAGQLTVSPAPREVPVLDETQFVYNGTVQKPNVTGVDGVYTVKNEGGTDVGTYSVTFTLVTENYYWATEEENVDTVTLTYKIVQAEYSFSFDVSDTVYNGAPVSVNAPGLPAGETGASVAYLFTGMMNGGRAYSSSDAPTEAGSYTVRVTISGMHNYKDAEASAEFTIERAPIKVSLTFKPQVDGGNGWVYGTTPKDIYELDKSSNPGQGGVTATYSTGSWSGSAIPTEVGEYTLTVTVAETNNYESGSASVAFKIVQASEDELSFTVSIDGWTYGEEPHAPSVIWGGGLTGHPDQISPVYTYAKAKADGETYSDKDFSPTVPTNAGSYVVKATFAETENYSELSKMCQFNIDKATALIDTSGVKTNFTYNGRAQAVGGAVLNHSETTLVYSPATVTAVGTYTVDISAAETANYSKVSVTVTVTVSRASAGFSVSIDDWTYGETPSRYVISGGSGGSVSVTYSGTTNAGVKYSSSKVPTEAGEYTITVVMGASGNFLGGTARDSFTIHRAKAEAELSLAGWMYGEEPNAYVLTPEFLRGEVVRVIYTDGTYYSEAVPKEVGSYTLTVTYGETDNYLGGEVSCKFSIVPYGLGLTVTLEGWTYGDKANEPIVTGAGGIGLMYAYTGTANDGTVWNSNTAPEKAGSYTLTVTVIEAGNYTGESASTDFVIARRLLSAPAWDEEGMRELIEVCSGDRMTRAILGFDMSLMNAQSATAQFMFDGTGAASVTAYEEGTYLVQITLKDAANYGWADLNEGETLTGPVTLTWTLTERVISLLWLIILLAVLIVIALIVLIVLLKKGGKPDGMDTEEGGKPDGTDTGKSDVRLSSVAPVGLLLVVAPLGEIIAVVVLGVVLAAVVIADIAVGVRNAKRAKAAENAQEPVPAYGDEAAAEGEAYPGTEVPADDGADVASDEDGMPE